MLLTLHGFVEAGYAMTSSELQITNFWHTLPSGIPVIPIWLLANLYKVASYLYLKVL